MIRCPSLVLSFSRSMGAVLNSELRRLPPSLPDGTGPTPTPAATATPTLTPAPTP